MLIPSIINLNIFLYDLIIAKFCSFFNERERHLYIPEKGMVFVYYEFIC